LNDKKEDGGSEKENGCLYVLTDCTWIYTSDCMNKLVVILIAALLVFGCVHQDEMLWIFEDLSVPYEKIDSIHIQPHPYGGLMDEGPWLITIQAQNDLLILEAIDSQITEHVELGLDVGLMDWLAKEYSLQTDEIEQYSQGYLKSRNVQIYRNQRLRGYTFLTITSFKSEL